MDGLPLEDALQCRSVPCAAAKATCHLSSSPVITQNKKQWLCHIPDKVTVASEMILRPTGSPSRSMYHNINHTTTNMNSSNNYGLAQLHVIDGETVRKSSVNCTQPSSLACINPPFRWMISHWKTRDSTGPYHVQQLKPLVTSPL